MPQKKIEPQALAYLERQAWPGNVRELENLIKRVFVLAQGPVLELRDFQMLKSGFRQTPSLKKWDPEALEALVATNLEALLDRSDTADLKDAYHRILPLVERPLISLVLKKTNGNQIRAARLLGINRNTLRKKIRELKVERRGLVKKGILSSLFFIITSLATLSNAHAVNPLNPESTESLKSHLSEGGALSPWISIKLSEGYLAQKKYAEAAIVLERMGEGGPWDFWKNTILAQAYLKRGQARKALRIIDNLPSEPEFGRTQNQDTYRSLYRAALTSKILALKKSGKETTPYENRLWALSPGPEYSFNAAPPMGVQMGDKITFLSWIAGDEGIKVIPTFMSVDEIASSTIEVNQRCRALLDWGRLNRRLKETNGALEAYSRMMNLRCGGEEEVQALYWKGKLEKGLKLYDAAIDSFKKLAKTYPDHRYRDDALYKIWRIYQSIRNTGESRKAFRTLVNLPWGDMRAEALWAIAYDAIKAGDAKSAMRHLSLMVDARAAQDESIPRALYWKARLIERGQVLESGVAEGARALYAKTERDYPFSFYAVLAANRLGVIRTTPVPLPVKIDPPREAVLEEMTKTVDLLNDLGYGREAQEVLDYYSHLFREETDSCLPYMAQKWMESGDYHQALLMASEALQTPLSAPAYDTSNPLVRILYPAAYSHQVDIGYGKTNLARGTLEGIMREESLFQPQVRSWAGAIGVMQLMPKTARMEARKIGLTPFSVNDLIEPKTNITLGSSFFNRMIDFFDGHYPLAVMSYNAGPGNVKKWLRRLGHLPLDEFIEEVPLSETRGYVKRVLRSMQVYGVLFNEPQLTQPFFSMEPPARLVGVLWR